MDTSPLRTLAVSLVLLATNAASAQQERLNEPFAYQDTAGAVADFVIPTPGSHVLFRAEARRVMAQELFVVPLHGGAAPFRLHGPLGADGTVRAYAAGHSGWVVYLADAAREDVFELFSRRPGDTQPRRLHAPLTALQSVTHVALAAGDNAVVYRSDAEVDERHELFVVPVNGDLPPRKLSAPLVEGGDVSRFQVSPDGGTVLYWADQEIDGLEELYAVKLTASSAPWKVNPGLSLDDRIESARMSADSVVYLKSNQAGKCLLFHAPLDGSVAVRITPQLPPSTTGVSTRQYELSADGRYALYVHELAPSSYGIQSAALDGSRPPLTLNLPLADGTSVERFALSADGTRVAFTVGGFRLYSAPASGAAPPALLEQLTDLRTGQIRFAPDGLSVVYEAGLWSPLAGFLLRELRAVPSDGSAVPRRLDAIGGNPRGAFEISSDSARVLVSWGADGQPTQGLYTLRMDGTTAPQLVFPGTVSNFALSLDGATVVMRVARSGAENVFELFSCSALDGTQAVQLSAELALGTSSDVGTFMTFPQPSFPRSFVLDVTGQRALFTADDRSDERFELFSAHTDGRGSSLPLSGDVQVSRPSFSPDGQWAIYVETAGAEATQTLHAVPAGGGAPPSLLSNPSPGARVVQMEISPDSTHAIYLQRLPGTSTDLCSAPLGGGAPLLLHSGGVQEFRVTPSGIVVFRVNYFGQLFGVPLDGSVPAQLITPEDKVISFTLTPDGLQCVYQAGQSGVFAVYVVPTDGSAPPQLLSGATNAAGSPLQVSADARWLVFVGRDHTDWVFRLFAARLDGSSGVRELSGPMTAGGGLHHVYGDASVRISPDSSRVAYLADQEQDETVELFGVPIDGSAAPRKLSPGLASGDVYRRQGSNDLAFSPDGTRVVFLVHGEQQPWQLFSAPVDGHAAAVPLSSRALPHSSYAGFTTQSAFELLPDSSGVVFCADEEASGMYELFLTPLDGGSPPLKLNRPLAKHGCVGEFALTADGRRVVYQATERAWVTELFSGPVPALPQQRHLRRP